MKQKLTQERLKELLDYDPETGVFKRKIYRAENAKAGDIPSCVNNTSGYLEIMVDGKRYKAHRLSFLFMEGYFPENDIDHIDRDKLNNKWNNLREVSKTCNKRNQSVYKNNKSGITGIYWRDDLNKWRSYIRIKNLIHLGYFDNIIDAVKARWEAEVKYNFPNCNTTSPAYNYLKKHGVI